MEEKNREIVLDALDRSLLAALQADSSRSIADLADQIGTSSSACHRRIKSLEAAGLITGFSARLDPQPLSRSPSPARAASRWTGSSGRSAISATFWNAI
jgi:DNA-binding Lrp family transcriptional regulator